MSRKQWLIFISLVLLPVVIGLTFRTIENQRFHQRLKTSNKDTSPEGHTKTLPVRDDCYLFIKSIESMKF